MSRCECFFVWVCLWLYYANVVFETFHTRTHINTYSKRIWSIYANRTHIRTRIHTYIFEHPPAELIHNLALSRVSRRHRRLCHRLRLQSYSITFNYKIESNNFLGNRLVEISRFTHTRIPTFSPGYPLAVNQYHRRILTNTWIALHSYSGMYSYIDSYKDAQLS